MCSEKTREYSLVRYLLSQVAYYMHESVLPVLWAWQVGVVLVWRKFEFESL